MTKVKFYECIKEIQGMADVGQKFICWDGEKMFPQGATKTSAYLSQTIVETAGFEVYFKECAPFYCAFVRSLVQDAEETLLDVKAKQRRLHKELLDAQNAMVMLEGVLYAMPSFKTPTIL